MESSQPQLKRICDYEQIYRMDVEQLLEFLTTGQPRIFGDERGIKEFQELRVFGAALLTFRKEDLIEIGNLTYSTIMMLLKIIEEANARRQEKKDSLLYGRTSGQSIRSDHVDANNCRVVFEVLGGKSKATQYQIDKLLIQTQIQLKNPSLKLSIPFVFHGPIPVRFTLDDEGRFEFYGRSFFQTLFETVSGMDSGKCKRLYLDGTSGSGKSHTIAASVPVLRQSGKLVCYIPDAHELLIATPTAQYLIEALYFTFEGDEVMQKNLRDLAFGSLPASDETVLESSLSWFCARAAADGKIIIFMIDQANALDEDLDNQAFNQNKARVRALLDAVSHRHIKVESSTANYRTAKQDRGRDVVGAKRLILNGGLDDDEMHNWWGFTTDEIQWELSEADRRAFERLTGRMPKLLTVLKSCALREKSESNSRSNLYKEGAISKNDEHQSYYGVSRSGRFTCDVLNIRQRMASSTEVENLYREILDFGLCQLARLKDREEERDRFLRAWQSCIFEMPVGRYFRRNLDARYFYVDEGGIGRSTSDFAREVGATILESSLSPISYADRAWTKNILSFAGNASVLGFAIKKIAIAHLIANGSNYADRQSDPEFPKTQFGAKLRYITFHDPVPPLEIYSTAGLDEKKTRASTKVQERVEHRLIYVPAIFNYPSVDCVLVFVPGTEENSAKTDKSTTAPSKKRKRTNGSSIPRQTSPPTSDINIDTVPKAVVVGVQFAISDNHRQTEVPFLKRWKDWENILPWDGEVEHRFLWVFDKIPKGQSHDWQLVPAKENPTRSGGVAGRMIHPEYYTRSIEFKHLDKHLGNAIDKARMGN